MLEAIARRPLFSGSAHKRGHATSLSVRAMGAGIWTVAGMGVQYPLRLASNLIMTRLLAPEDFGLMAVVLMLHLGLGLLSDVGIQQSVMRHPRGGTPRYLRLAWSVQVLRGLALTGFVLVLGGLVALAGPVLASPDTVYGDPRLPWLIWASSAMVVVTGLQSANVMRAARRLEIRYVVTLEIASQILGLAVMIALALWFQNVWALLWGAVVGATAKTALSHLALPGPRMRWRWDPAEAGAMWRFGRWIIGASVGGFLVSHGDQLVFSALMDKSTFGIYAIAMLWVGAGGQILNRVAAAVFMPSFGEVLNTRPEDTGPVLRKALLVNSVISVGVAGALLVAGILTVAHLYDPRYAAAIPFIAVLSFRNLVLRFGVLRHFVTATGDSRHVALASLGGGLAGVTALYAAFTWFGLSAALAVAALTAVPMFACVATHPVLRRHIPWQREICILAAVTIACLIATAIVL